MKPTSPKAGHSPGPWFVMQTSPTAVACSDEAGTKIAATRASHGFLDIPESVAEANARLIAASPDMPAALKEIVASSDAYEGSQSDDERCRKALEVARAVIARAEGGPDV